jgi:hypothetical protein
VHLLVGFVPQRLRSLRRANSMLLHLLAFVARAATLSY